MRTQLSFVAGLCLVASLAPVALADKQSNEQLAEDVQAAIDRFQEEDSSFKPTLKQLAGYAIFPEVAKGGLIVGGAGGRGEVYQGGKLVGYAQLSQGSVGAQIGGQKFSQAVFFKQKSALKRFKKNRLELSAQATANASDQGGAAAAKYADGVAIIILPISGLMAEASVGGQKFNFTPLDKTGKK